MVNGIEYFNIICEQEVLTEGLSTFGIGGATIETLVSKGGVLRYAQVLKKYQDSLSEDFFTAYQRISFFKFSLMKEKWGTS
jgi:hypothetical protein